MIVTLADRQVSYVDRGPRDGKPVLYLHGMPGSRLESGIYITDEMLERSGTRIIAIDRPGWGHTEFASGGRVARVADIVRLCDHLGVDSFTVMAVSSGGSYALTLAAVAPDRVERVVLVSAQMPYDDDMAIAGLLEDQRALVPILRTATRELLTGGVRNWADTVAADGLDGFGSGFDAVSPAERSFLDRPLVRDAFAADIREGFAQGIDGALDDLLLQPVPFEVDLAAVRCPVVAIHGNIDNWEPLPNLERHLSRLRDARLFVIDGCNHFGPMLYPEVLLALLT